MRIHPAAAVVQAVGLRLSTLTSAWTEFRDDCAQDRSPPFCDGDGDGASAAGPHPSATSNGGQVAWPGAALNGLPGLENTLIDVTINRGVAEVPLPILQVQQLRAGVDARTTAIPALTFRLSPIDAALLLTSKESAGQTATTLQLQRFHRALTTLSTSSRLSRWRRGSSPSRGPPRDARGAARADTRRGSRTSSSGACP